MVDTGQNVVKPSSVQIYLLYARVIKKYHFNTVENQEFTYLFST